MEEETQEVCFTLFPYRSIASNTVFHGLFFDSRDHGLAIECGHGSSVLQDVL